MALTEREKKKQQQLKAKYFSFEYELNALKTHDTLVVTEAFKHADTLTANNIHWVYICNFFVLSLYPHERVCVLKHDRHHVWCLIFQLVINNEKNE